MTQEVKESEKRLEGLDFLGYTWRRDGGLWLKPDPALVTLDRLWGKFPDLEYLPTPAMRAKLWPRVRDLVANVVPSGAELVRVWVERTPGRYAVVPLEKGAFEAVALQWVVAQGRTADKCYFYGGAGLAVTDNPEDAWKVAPGAPLETLVAAGMRVGRLLEAGGTSAQQLGAVCAIPVGLKREPEVVRYRVVPVPTEGTTMLRW